MVAPGAATPAVEALDRLAEQLLPTTWLRCW
jgi:hypothetical protein